MNSPNEEYVRKRFEEERSRKAEASQRVRERVRVFSRVVAWLIVVFFTVMTVLALYVEYPLVLELIAGHQEGWVPTGFLAVFLFFIVGLVVSLGLLVFWALKYRHLDDDS